MSFLDKAAVALRIKPAPRRRGLGKKNPIRIAAETKANGERSIVPRRSSLQVVGDGIGPAHVLERAYKEVSGVGGINSDWAISAISEDSDVWQNIFTLRQRSRDLFRTNVYFKKYKEELFANVFGSEGITLRMRVKEVEDRVVYSAAEKGCITEDARRRDRISQYIERRFGKSSLRVSPFAFRDMSRQSATVQVGDLDLYANKIIEDAWKRWQRRENCTVSGVLSYNEVRQMRLLSAARDGDFFIRFIRDPRINEFGFSLQLINSEWCDFYLNQVLDNGNEIRMGIERNKWGKRVAYWFIKRQPMDWQFSTPGAYMSSSREMHERIPADEIIHYARYEDGDSTRPAPWAASLIVKARHLDKGEEAEVTAMRVNACKMGFFQSTVDPNGGTGVGEKADPTKSATLEAEPGSFQGLPWGVEFKEWNPSHPNQNFPGFRKEMLRAICAGLPGANYNIIANDLEGVNYSSGRLGMLDERELWKLIQKFDIDIAERPVFEEWLYMALLTGAISLPLAKFDKFNQPVFRGRRWAWVDPLKEIQASALTVANKFTSRTRVIEDSDVDADFEEILFELAEEEMMMTELGMDTSAVTGKSPQSPDKNGQDAQNTSDSGDEADTSSKARESDDQMNLELFVRAMEATRQPAPAAAPAITVNVPEIKMPQPIIDMSSLKLPEQKAPIVNVAAAKFFVPEIKMPEVKSPDVVVNVAPPAVNIENKVNVPAASKVKIGRGKDGKMTHAEIERN